MCCARIELILSVASAYLSPGNLSNAFPFFADVTDVASFDSGAFGYFSNPYQYQTTKFADELGCTNATSNDAVIRWQRTVLCSQWVNEKWSIDCTNLYSGSPLDENFMRSMYVKS